MPRTRSPDSIEAEKLYKAGMSLADIARKLEKPEGTVRRWKSTQKWDVKESERSETKASVRKDNRTESKEAIAEAVDQVLDNQDLTDKQRLFCLYQSKMFNGTKAYMKAYPDSSYETAMVESSRLLRTPKISEEIRKLKQARLNRELLEPEDVFQWYLDIARADITDFATIESGWVTVKDSDSIDGMLVQELSQGKMGVKIKLNDRMKAMDWIADHMDLATEEQKARIEQMRSKMESNNDQPIQITFTKASEKHGGE